MPLRGIKCQANYGLASLRIKNGIFGGVGYFLIYSDESLAGLPQYMVVGVEWVGVKHTVIIINSLTTSKTFD